MIGSQGTESSGYEEVWRLVACRVASTWVFCASVAGDEGWLFSFPMVSLRIASIGFVFLRPVCYFMYTGEGVVCVCAGLSKRWRVRLPPPPHVFKVTSCF